MQFSEIQTIVNDHLETSSFTNWTAAYTKRWINRAVRWACNGQVILPETKQTLTKRVISHDFSFLITEVQASTVDEQRKYALPDGSTATIWEFRKDKNIELIDYNSYRKNLYKLHKTDIEDDPDFSYLLDKGIPSHYCIEGSKIFLYPLPDHSYNNDTAFTINMEYYSYLPELINDADTNVFTNKFPELIEWKATALGMEWAKDEQVKYFNDKADEKLLEIITNDQSFELGGIEMGMQPTAGARLGA
jgi:hypothetical protein